MTSRRLPVSAIAVALLLVTAGCLGAISDDSGDDDGTESEHPDADELLEAAIDAETNVETLQGIQTVTMTDGEESVTTTQEVWMRTPAEQRTEVVETDEPQAFGVTVTDGETMWMYDEADNEAVVWDHGFDTAEQDAMAEGFTEPLTDGMDASLEGTDTVADRDAYVLELTPDGDDAVYESATLWIDQETDYPLKQEMTPAMDGATTTIVAFEEITFNESIDDEVFTFEAPEDADVRDFDELTPEQYPDLESADADVPFDLPEPDVPADYELQSVTAGENLVGWNANLQYIADDGSFLSVGVAEESETQDPAFEPESEPLELEGVDATIREPTAGNAIVEWTDDGLTYTISGDLERESLIDVAESIVE